MRSTRSPLRPNLTAVTTALTLLAVAVLLASDVVPGMLRAEVHGKLAAVALALCALACLLPHFGRTARPAEWAKPLIAAFAFLFWAANQMCLDPVAATVLNDIAIALFALDVFLVLAGWTPLPRDESGGSKPTLSTRIGSS